MKLQRDLREFIELLNSHGVEYLVVGGHAVAFHGYPRFTGDVDFFVRSTAENARRLIAVLAAFGFGQAGLDEATLMQPEKIVQLGVPPNRIDLLTSISGVDFVDAWSDRIPDALDGVPVAFVSKRTLVANKRASGRPKDLVDLEKLGG